MKRLFFAILFLSVTLSVLVQGQNPLRAYQLWLYNNTDSTLRANTGIIRFDPATGKFRFGNGVTWTSFSSSGGQVLFNTPDQYGAAGDGSTNDQAACQSCVNASVGVGSKPCLILIKNYRVNSTITVPTGARILGFGDGSIISTTSNISILTIQGHDAHLSDFQLLGSDAGAVQRGIDITGNAGLTLDYTSNHLTNIRCKDFGQAGLYATLVFGVPSATVHLGAVYAVNCKFESSVNGVFLDNRAEYNTFTNCIFYGNTTGVRIAAGNNDFKGGAITDGTTGVIFSAGNNDGKCVFNGVKINHNTTAVSSGATTAGSRFQNCELIANGSVSLTLAVGYTFEGNTFGATTLTFNSSTLCEFINNRFTSTPTISLVAGSLPYRFGNTYDVGAVPPAGFENQLHGKLTLAGSATLEPINIGQLASRPSAPTNGAVIVNSTNDAIEAYVDGAWVTSITNTAAANELMKSNGTMAVPSGLFSTTDGNILLGNASGSGGSRTISAQGSASDISVIITPKGTNPTSLTLSGDNSAAIDFVSSPDILFTPTQISTNNESNLTVIGGPASGADAGNLIISGGGSSGVAFGAGDLLLNGGSAAAATGNQAGGDVIITGGLPGGTGDTGDIIIETTNDDSGTFKINSGANEQVGLATLVGGTVTVNNTKVTANSYIFMNHRTTGGTIGTLSYTIVAGTSFTITSSSGTDTSTVNWWIVEPN